MSNIYEDFALTKIRLRSCDCGALQYHPEGTKWWKCAHCKAGAPFTQDVPEYWVLIKPLKKKLDHNPENNA